MLLPFCPPSLPLLFVRRLRAPVDCALLITAYSTLHRCFVVTLFFGCCCKSASVESSMLRIVPPVSPLVGDCPIVEMEGPQIGDALLMTPFLVELPLAVTF